MCNHEEDDWWAVMIFMTMVMTSAVTMVTMVVTLVTMVTVMDWW